MDEHENGRRSIRWTDLQIDAGATDGQIQMILGATDGQTYRSSQEQRTDKCTNDRQSILWTNVQMYAGVSDRQTYK